MNVYSTGAEGTSLPLSNENLGIALNSHFLIIDPHPLFSQALTSLLGQCGAQSVRNVVKYTDVIKLAKIRPGTVIFFNMSTPGSKGALGLDRILEKVSVKSVIAVLEHEDIALENLCIERGIGGIISKLHSPDQIKEVVSAVMLGKAVELPLINLLSEEQGARARLYKQVSTLSPKEVLVFSHLKEGSLNKQIAFELELSEATIKYHVGNILRKLKCHSRTQAAVIANRHVFFS
jgi:DNA-binding NarL/FixJ family response regulator